MSEAHIESDQERAAREGATIQVGKDAHGKPSFALMLLDPKGNLQQVPIGTKLKPGWGYASRADYERKQQEELERQRREAGEDDEPELDDAPTSES